jgi:hypothetical protein
MLCLSIISCFLFNKIEKRAELVLPGSKEGGEPGWGAGERGGPNNVCIYE